MNILSKFSPAETLLLTQGKDAKLKDLLKVTLMDLLLKQALQTIEVAKPPGEKSTPAYNVYVIKGANLNFYHPLEHEKVFLAPFYTNADQQILFNNVVKIGYERSKSEKQFSSLIMKNGMLDRYFEHGVMSLFKGRLTHTQAGQDIAKELQSTLDQLQETLPDIMENNPAKAREILASVKGSIFILKGIDFKLMREIENHVVAEQTRNYSASNSFMSDTVMWIALDSHFHSFDNSFNNTHHNSGTSWDGNSDSGGDSGCSGCGGID